MDIHVWFCLYYFVVSIQYCIFHMVDHPLMHVLFVIEKLNPGYVCMHLCTYEYRGLVANEAPIQTLVGETDFIKIVLFNASLRFKKTIARFFQTIF